MTVLLPVTVRPAPGMIPRQFSAKGAATPPRRERPPAWANLTPPQAERLDALCIDRPMVPRPIDDDLFALGLVWFDRYAPDDVMTYLTPAGWAMRQEPRR